MNKAKLIIRILFGLMLVIFGLNKLLQFMPMPPMPEAAGEFMGALVKSGYLMFIVAIVEVVAGVLLLVNKYQSLALVVVFPVILNAFLFHLFLDLAGVGGAAVAMAMNIFLFFANKESYKSLFNSK
ncbi:MAG: putative oxidoreductase [Vicingaceae bacterium]|jgi:putative oxidoreductase